VITGCNSHYNQFLSRQLQNIDISVEYKETEQARLTCRMCVLLWHNYLSIKLKKVVLWWQTSSTEWEITLIFRLYCRAMGGEPVSSIGMWNVNKHHLRTNSAVEGWNCKLKSSIGKQQPDVCLLVRKWDSWYLATEMKGNWRVQPKRRKNYVNQGERFNNMWKNMINQMICTSVWKCQAV